MWQGGTDEERAIVARALWESAYPWRRFAEHRTMRVRFFEGHGLASGGAIGLALPTGNLPYLQGAIDHELGHVLDAWLLTYGLRNQYRDRYCQHTPQHSWGTDRDTDHCWALGESFANTYAWAFHSSAQPGMCHGFPFEDRDWFTDWILGLPPTVPVWI